MKYRRLSNEEILAGVTSDPGTVLEPFLDTLQAWADTTHTDRKPWGEYDVAIDSGVVTVDGFPLHPYVQTRLLSRVVGIRNDKMQPWREHPDLILEALQRFDPFRQDVQLRAVAGQVVVMTDIDMELGHHIDFIKPMADSVVEAAKRGTAMPVSMVGYVLDPAWMHLRLAFVSTNRDQPHHVGLHLDANHLFNRRVKGRASYGLFSYDTVWRTGMTMDNWWSVPTPRIREDRPDVNLRDRFLETLGKQHSNARKEIRYAASSLTSRRKAKAKPTWKNAVVNHFTKTFGAQGRAQEALLNLDEHGHDNPFDFAMALLTTVEQVEFYRRLAAERYISGALRKLTK